MFRRAIRSAMVILALVVTAGCGSEEPPTSGPSATEPPANPDRLSRGEQRQAFESQQSISAYCRQRALALQGPEPPPSGRDARRAFSAANRLVELARARPFDLVQTGVDTRLYLSDLVEDLGNVECDPALIARLEEGLG